ncbi:sensor histidine kinase [Actinoplanes sp. NPDC023801]|uniref:sensor histidine kinase n=1 Tax=Actinoplanes sp. NPDC023801 TaxID=3154595 RepID=UPI0033F30CF5
MKPVGRVDACDPPGAARPGRRSRARRHSDWPPGSAIAASIFHLAGTDDLADRGLVHIGPAPLYFLLLLAGPVALLWRRKAPMVAFGVAAAASIAFASHAQPYWMYAVAPALALFSLAKLGRRTEAAIAGAVAWAVYLLITVGLAGPLGLPADARPDLREAMLAAVGIAASVLLGTVSKVRHEQLAAIARARAEQQRAHDEQERRQASEERLRMAQELHDVLGHHLSLINVQAGVGLHLMDNRPEQAREALSAIKAASAEALREVRSVLGVLRTEGEAAPRQPALGLSRLAGLTADAGFPVRTRIGGDPRVLPAEVDRAAYRIVQEALTNVRRHAGPGPHVLVEITYQRDALALSITSTGDSPESFTPGSGITGMRARAESLGGQLAAGPHAAGGFGVTVLLPAPPVPGAGPPPEGSLPESTGPAPSPWGTPGVNEAAPPAAAERVETPAWVPVPVPPAEPIETPVARAPEPPPGRSPGRAPRAATTSFPTLPGRRPDDLRGAG